MDIQSIIEKADQLTENIRLATIEHRYEEVESFFKEMKQLPDLPRINQIIFGQYANIIRDYGSQRQMERIESLYAECMASDRKEDMEWEIHWVTCKMIEALIFDGQSERAEQMRNAFKNLVSDDAQDQAWLNYYLKELDKAFADPASIYGIPLTPDNEDKEEDTPLTENEKENRPIRKSMETEGRDFWCGNHYQFDDYARLRKPYSGRNLWLQPTRFTESTRGRTDEELSDFEKGLGYVLPELYKQHMKLQNGGIIRYDTYVCGDIVEPLFGDVTIEPIPAIGGTYEPLSEVYGSYMDREMWDEQLGKGANPDRLYVLSYMYGHEILALDYGIHEPTPRSEPEVVYYNTEMDFEENFRLPSYKHLIDHLVYNQTEYYAGVKTQMSLDQLMLHLSEKLLADKSKLTPGEINILESKWVDFSFEKVGYDPNYGIYDFDYYYRATIQSDNHRYFIKLMLNRRRGGNYIFQDDTECNFIIEINPGNDNYGNAMAGPALIENILNRIADPAVESKIILPGQ